MANNSEKGQIQQWEDFVKYCDIFLARAKISKESLAKNLGINPSHFSRLYNGHEAVTSHMLESIKQLCQEPVIPTPEKIAIQEHLPLNLTHAMREIAKMQATQDRDRDSNDRDRKENLELRDRVAVLEDHLKQAKLDGEKKIHELESRVAYTIRTEIEQLTSRLSRAAND